MMRCQLCGKVYGTIYHIPDEIWAKITPSKYHGGGVLCLECAELETRKRGITLYWSAAVERFLDEEG